MKYFILHYPVTFIICNLTVLKKTPYVISYAFNGSIPKPITIQDLCYIVYYIDTAKKWKGNTTGRLEYRAYGKEPVFGRTYGHFEGHYKLSEINGGKSIIHIWNDTKIERIELGIRYNGDLPTLSEIGKIVADGAFFMTVCVLIIVIIKRVVTRRKRTHNIVK